MTNKFSNIFASAFQPSSINHGDAIEEESLSDDGDSSQRHMNEYRPNPIAEESKEHEVSKSKNQLFDRASRD